MTQIHRPIHSQFVRDTCSGGVGEPGSPEAREAIERVKAKVAVRRKERRNKDGSPRDLDGKSSRIIPESGEPAGSSTQERALPEGQDPG